MLSVTNLHVYRGTAHVVRGVSLTIEPGAIVCLVGRNGAGKTTTLSCVMGLLPAHAGAVAFNGREITGLPPHARARLGLGYAPEDCGIFPDLTVAEQLAIGFWMTHAAGKPEDGYQQEMIYTLFPELRRLLKRRGLQLSGGERKMVAIGRALATRPSVLLLDEPFEGLAPVVVNRLVEAVRKVKTLGLSLLIAESNVTVASRLADRLFVIERGEIIFGGTPEDISKNGEVLRTIRG